MSFGVPEPGAGDCVARLASSPDRHIQDGSGRQDDGAFDDVLKFTNIARPVYCTSASKVSDGIVSIVFPIRRPNCWTKWTHEQRDVVSTLPERRDSNRKHVEPIVEI